MAWVTGPDIVADYEMFQGYCFPAPAWEMYFWADKDRDYLRQLYATLEAHDAYLWADPRLRRRWHFRNVVHVGTQARIIVRVCSRATRRRAGRLISRPRATGCQTRRIPAISNVTGSNPSAINCRHRRASRCSLPFASMDVMSYSYSGRATLARIARELGNGREESAATGGGKSAGG